MSSLAETINNALRAIGRATEGRLRDVIADFDGMNLSAEERLSAVATTVAAAAMTHHRRHMPVYLEAVRTWSLEVAAGFDPPPPRLGRPPMREQIVDGAEVLITGIDALIEMMTNEGVRTHDRLIAELALVSRILGENDANTIHLALHTVREAVEGQAFQPGELVEPPLRATAAALGREVSLATLAPRGCA